MASLVTKHKSLIDKNDFLLFVGENLWSLVRISFGIYTLAYKRRRSFLL